MGIQNVSFLYEEDAKHRQRGFGLVVVILFAALIGILVAAQVARVKMELSARSGREQTLKASYAARAGLQRALIELSQDDHWSPGTFTGTLNNQANVSFEVEVLNNFGQSTDDIAPDGMTVKPNRVWLRSVGLIDGRRFTSKVGQAQALPVKPPPVFNYIFDEQGAQFVFHPGMGEQGFIDSFTGIPRAYVQTVTPGSPGTYQMQAKVRTSDNLEIISGFADADFEVPSLDLLVGGTANVSGTVTANPGRPIPYKFRMPRSFDSVTPIAPAGSGTLSPGRYTDLNIGAGQNLELNPGVYFFDNVNLGANASLSVSPATTNLDPCVVYIGKNFFLGVSSEVNLDAPPRFLQLYFTDENSGHSEIRFGDNSKCSAVAAGQYLIARFLTDCEFFGAMTLADLYEGINPRFHYDTSLRDQVLLGNTEWILFDEVSQ